MDVTAILRETSSGALLATPRPSRVIEPTDSSALDVVASMSKEQRKKLLMRIKNPFFDMRIN
jgi:hypothetical protein